MKNIENTEQLDNANLIHIRRSYQWKAAFFGLLILITGIAIGAASIMIFAPGKLVENTSGSEFNALRLMPSLRRNLSLSQAQVEQLRPILNNHMTTLSEIREQARTDISSVLIELNQEVSSILNEKQKIIWQRELLRLQQDLNTQHLQNGRGLRQGRGSQTNGNVQNRGQ